MSSEVHKNIKIYGVILSQSRSALSYQRSTSNADAGEGSFSTLKHGGYSANTILPGESLAKFKRLERDVIDDLRPDGAFEQDTVMRIVQLLWRRQNLATFRKVQLVKERYQAIRSEYLPPESFISLLECEKNEENKPRREGGLRAAEDQTRKELGKNYQLVEIGETATVEIPAARVGRRRETGYWNR